MMDNNERRPSRFSLSRYMVNECDPDEKRAIETWLASSDEARRAFDEFKEEIAREERTAAPLSPLKSGKLKSSLLHRAKQAWAIPAFLAALVVVAMTLVVSRNTSFRGGGAAIMHSSAASQQRLTFRDTLESLMQMTSKALRQSEETMLVADSQYQNISLTSSDRRRPLESGFSRADVTSVHCE
jgi:ferric-dicitrate binding protein FerR (iron transport regulator)